MRLWMQGVFSAAWRRVPLRAVPVMIPIMAASLWCGTMGLATFGREWERQHGLLEHESQGVANRLSAGLLGARFPVAVQNSNDGLLEVRKPNWFDKKRPHPARQCLSLRIMIP